MTNPILHIERVMADHKFHFNKYLQAMNEGYGKGMKYHSHMSQRLAEKLDHLVNILKQSER